MYLFRLARLPTAMLPPGGQALYSGRTLCTTVAPAVSAAPSSRARFLLFFSASSVFALTGFSFFSLFVDGAAASGSADFSTFFFFFFFSAARDACEASMTPVIFRLTKGRRCSERAVSQVQGGRPQAVRVSTGAVLAGVPVINTTCALVRCSRAVLCERQTHCCFTSTTSNRREFSLPFTDSILTHSAPHNSIRYHTRHRGRRAG